MHAVIFQTEHARTNLSKCQLSYATQHSHEICQTYVLDYLGIDAGFELEEDNVSDRHGVA